MLSTTYFLTALSIEQRKLHKILTDFQQHLQAVQSGISASVQEHYFDSLETAIKNFYQLENHCHERKIDLYLIPAIDKSAKDADQILAEIELLKSRSMNIFIDMQEKVEACFDQGISTVEAMCGAMKQYCDIQQAILTKEKNELVPMAQQRLPVDVWFSISAKCLADQDANREAGKFKATGKRAQIPSLQKVPALGPTKRNESEVSNRAA
jgi:hypothetical protein